MNPYFTQHCKGHNTCHSKSLRILTRKSSASSMGAMSTVSWFLSIMILANSCTKSRAQRNIFLLAGQSNMAGRGGVNGDKWDDNVPSECMPNPAIFRLNAQLQWELAREPLHADIDVTETLGVGPGMAFANEVVRATRGGLGAVGLVPCAVGGTKISQWSRGSRLYNRLVQRATESVKDGDTIRALLWYQGESDTVTELEADSYKTNMENFIMNIRSDLQVPSLLIIQVALASGEGIFIEKVREAQLGIQLENVKCVDAKGLPLNADNLHLTTMSQVNVGIKLAQAYLSSSFNLSNFTSP